MLNQVLRPIGRRALQAGVQQRFHGHYGGHYEKPVTFDEACKPEGDWKENYAKQQRRYNMHLLLGVVTFGLTVASVLKFELLFFNYAPPKLTEEDLKELDMKMKL